MAQVAFTQGNRVAGTQTGTVTVGTALVNVVMWNKTNGYVTGTITGGGTQTYSIRSQAFSDRWDNRVQVSNNGTNDFEVEFHLAPGHGTGWVMNASAAGGALTMNNVTMKHTATGASDSETDQVFLDIVS